MVDRRSQLALAAFALVAMACYAIAFFPGTFGFDSAYQWWQARGHQTTNIHGVGMTWLWRASNALATGPAPMFALQLALLWLGLVLLAARLEWTLPRRFAFMVAAACAPVVFVIETAVVSDALLMGALCCALGLCLWGGTRPGRWTIPAALALCALAVLVRKNALPAVFPLIVLGLRAVRGPGRRSWFGIVLASAGLCAMLQLAGMALERSVDRRVTIFAGTALWDLAAVSIDTGQLMLPPSTHGPGMDVEHLRRAFAPYANTTMFAAPDVDLIQPFLAPDDPRNGEIRRAWLAAIWRHPAAYLAQRWRVTRGLFGAKRPDWPRELVYFPLDVQYRDNPAVAGNTTPLHAWFMRQFDRCYASTLFAAWPYLVLGVGAGIVAWRRRGSPLADGALAAVASGLAYAAALPIIAPSVELRYLGWTCLAAVLGAGLALAAPRRLTRPVAATTLRAPSQNEASFRGPLQ